VYNVTLVSLLQAQEIVFVLNVLQVPMLVTKLEVILDVPSVPAVNMEVKGRQVVPYVV
jgi:hypothetical protein